MPPVEFFACLDFERKSSFCKRLDRKKNMTLKRLYYKLTNGWGTSSKKTAEEKSPDPADTRNGFDLQGAIDIVTIEGIFQLLYLTNLTGKLSLYDPPRQATFLFTNGQLIWGSLHKEDKQIGQRLISSAHITDQQLDECLDIQEQDSEEGRIGEILLRQGFLKPDILHASLKEQARDAFFSVLSWKSGTFSFTAGNPTEEDAVSVSERIDHLLLEGAVHLDKNGDGVTTTLTEDTTLTFFKQE